MIVSAKKDRRVGERDAEHFLEVMIRQLNTIEIVHEELAKRGSREAF